MAKTLIGNIKGKDGRGIASISKTGTTGSVDTYTIKYTDGTTSTYTVNNSDSIALQRQIVPSAAVESSTTASQAYSAGDYVVVNGILRKVKSAISKGNAISDSNSTATTVGGELATIGDSVSRSVRYALIPTRTVSTSASHAVTMAVSWPVDVSRIVTVFPTYTCKDFSDRVVLSNWDASGVTLRAGADQEILISLFVLYV